MSLSLAFAALTTLAVAVTDVPNPRAGGGWISDVADVIDPASEQRIDATIGALERDLGVEVAVITLPDVDGPTKDFAGALFERFRIGKAHANNGLLILLVVGQRRIEMETGYGLEALLPDGWLGSMQAATMLPAFKRGAFGEGLVAGVEAVVARVRARPEEATQGAAMPLDDLESQRSTPADLPRWPLAPVGLGLGGGIWAVVRRRRRTCAACKLRMTKLDELADDEHLEPGQRVEERVGAIDYEVLQCRGCGQMKILRHFSIFSGYSACSACRFRTLRTEESVLSSPTRHSEGLMRVHQSCKHCGHTAEHTRVVPRLPEPHQTSTSSWSSSSSGSSGSGGSSSRSSGGSFGGGRSGGGGAGSSW